MTDHKQLLASWQSLRESQLADPLSVPTRGQRKLLLSLSLVAIAITWADLVPSKVDQLGIQVSLTNQHSILILLAGAVSLAVTTFVFYAQSDLSQWNIRREIFTAAMSTLIAETRFAGEADVTSTNTPPEVTELELLALNAAENMNFYGKILLSGSRMRLFVDLVIPCCLGCIAFGMILFELKWLSTNAILIVSLSIFAGLLLWLKAPDIRVRMMRRRIYRSLDKGRRVEMESLEKMLLLGIARDMEQISKLPLRDRRRRTILNRTFRKVQEAYFLDLARRDEM